LVLVVLGSVGIGGIAVAAAASDRDGPPKPPPWIDATTGRLVPSRLPDRIGVVDASGRVVGQIDPRSVMPALPSKPPTSVPPLSEPVMASDGSPVPGAVADQPSDVEEDERES